MSIITLPLGPILEILYFQDYWLPGSIFSFSIGSVRILIEDLIFVFSVSGVASVLYEIFLRKHLIRLPKKIHYFFGLPVILLIGAIVTYTFFILGMNSIFATSIGFVLVALLMSIQRHDLFKDALGSGLTLTIVMFIGYISLSWLVLNGEEILQTGWFLHGSKLDVRFINVPLTEIIWYFAYGMMIGPLYEFTKKMRIK